MTDEAKTLVERLQEIAQFIEAAKRHVYGLPVAAIRSDTHDNKMALWCDNGMAGVGQVCVSVNVGEFPDQQLSAIAGLTNAAMSALKCLYASADLIETQAREAAAKDAEIARLRKELSDMATKYSCAVDTFNTGFSGYEAVLLHQRRIADEGPPSNWKDGMKAYAARAALAGDSHE